MTKVKSNTKKTISTGKKLLIALIFSISAVFFGILLSFSIKYFYLWIITQDKYNFDESMIGLVFSLIIGLVFFKTLSILLKDYDRNKKEKNAKWYVDKVFAALILVWITIAVVLMSFYAEEEDIGYLVFSITTFIIIGISVTPNTVLYALNDMKNWKNIFYNNGNLYHHKRVDGFYMMQAPVPFERKLYFAVLKEQLLNLSTVAIFIILFIMIDLFSKSYESVTPGNIISAVVHTKSIRADGYFFFGSVFLASFWIPIFAYYIANAVYKLRVVRRHEYIVYHAIVDRVDTFKIRINNRYVNYAYDYCTCVGVKSKNINKTKAILVFVPDDLLLFPDNEE